MVLACLMVLVLAIGVITTVNLGHSVHERIRLQNSADAAAYSMAAMEARAFNFYAFANRTQVSHYVSAMIWQSVASVIFFLEAWITDLYAFLLSLPGTQCAKPSGYMKVLCTALENVPYIGPVIKALDTFLSTLYSIVQGVQTALGASSGDYIDKFIGVIVRGLGFANRGYSAISQAIATATLTHVGTASSDIIIANDPNADPGAAKYLSGAINTCIFQRAHYDATGIAPIPSAAPWDPMPVGSQYNQENNKVSRAKRSMGQITNASRMACDTGGYCGVPGYVTKRTLSGLLPLSFMPSAITTFIDNLVPKDGQTRMLSWGYARGYYKKKAINNYIRQNNTLPNQPMGQLGQGDAIGSDDLYRLSIPLGGINFGVGSAYNPWHCYHHKPEDEHDLNQEDMTDYEECWGDPFFREKQSSNYENFDALKTSIWALHPSDKGYNGGANNNGGIHWRLMPDKKPSNWKGWKKASNKNTNYRKIGLNDRKFCVIRAGWGAFSACVWHLPWRLQYANVRPVEDGNHTWDGLARFPHFEPGQYAKDCSNPTLDASTSAAANRNTEFNQPSSWLFLNKNPDKLQNPIADPTATRNGPALLNSSKKLDVSITNGSTTTLELDNTRKKFLFVFDGMTVVSRGQTYYHRPGNWAEQPNFFNPYWRPRLASVWQGRYSLPLLGGWANEVKTAQPQGSNSDSGVKAAAQAAWTALKNLPQKIITH